MSKAYTNGRGLDVACSVLDCANRIRAGNATGALRSVLWLLQDPLISLQDPLISSEWHVGCAISADVKNHLFRLAATADLHCKTTSAGSFRELFGEIAENADALALCGDLVDYGLPEEAEILVKEANPVLKKNIPVLAVFGNHEFESGKADQVRRMLTDGGIKVLDGEACEIAGIGFAGIKGFSGGFGERVLEPWGEQIIKRFVGEAVNESLKLESALARLRTSQRIALLHYAPIATTVIGEPPEVFPFLGCSRLEEPLGRYPVTAVIHGHAHRGSPEGRTKNGAPVFNVAMGVMESTTPVRLYRILELPLEVDDTASAQ